MVAERIDDGGIVAHWKSCPKLVFSELVALNDELSPLQLDSGMTDGDMHLIWEVTTL